MDLVSESEFDWNCLYRNWNRNLISKTELTPALDRLGCNGMLHVFSICFSIQSVTYFLFAIRGSGLKPVCPSTNWCVDARLSSQVQH